ncbi:GNAT family N-acetyltransferase [[Clostridium] spiroforme]|nr:GNAT family N-acetyltransferase [Thomasclavelia spiroformis]
MKIETARLIIKDLTLSDAIRFSDYRNKPEVAKYQSWKYYSLKKAQKRIKYTLDHPFAGKIGNYQLGIYLIQSDYLIGDLFIEIEGKTTFTVGYTIDSEYWAKGYASEAVSALLDYMHHSYHFKMCLAHVYEDNERSIRLLKKLGFEYIHKSWFYQDVLYRKNLNQ